MHMIYDVYLMQSEYIHASREWERERASYREQIDQLHVRLVAFRIYAKDMLPNSGGGDA